MNVNEVSAGAIIARPEWLKLTMENAAGHLQPCY